ncbi:MAG: metal-dependent transcriptional regulator [Actinomycetaceae bacterium]|nr:metal-dependent transcriptional regulator [Actinomycetaceae bacterium]
MSGLIDTTEMYLKTVFELLEEGIPALRARIVERLSQSGPTVSETVARMERDGLLKVGANREISFTAEGYEKAVAVMRRHRLAERLLLDVIKIDWKDVHNEACRWEHVISDPVAERINELLGNPETDPFGNPIPCCVSRTGIASAPDVGLFNLASSDVRGKTVTVERFAEPLQLDDQNLENLADLGIVPGAELEVLDSDELAVRVGEWTVAIPVVDAESIFVR